VEIFASQDVDLRISTLPKDLDPFDLLVQQGAEPFRAVLASGIDALEFKIDQVLASESAQGIEGRRRAVDGLLRLIALSPELPGQDGAIKRELMVTRISQRLSLKEETIWARLKEIRQSVREQGRREPVTTVSPPEAEVRSARAAPEERDLLMFLLADPGLVEVALRELPASEVEHPGLRRLLDGLYALRSEGQSATLDALRMRIEEPRLLAKALELQEIGSQNPDRPGWLRQILAEFRRKRQLQPRQQELKNQLQGTGDHEAALALLRQLQNPT
jgi:DNA primase